MEKLKVKAVYAAPNQPTTGGRFERFVQTGKSLIDSVLKQDKKIDVPFATALACASYKWVSLYVDALFDLLLYANQFLYFLWQKR